MHTILNWDGERGLIVIKRIKPYFRWFDLWMGLYIDTKNKTWYLGYCPMLGLKIEWEDEPLDFSAMDSDMPDLPDHNGNII